MKIAVFWDVAPCRSCLSRRFGGTYHLHLQGRKIRERFLSARDSKRESIVKQWRGKQASLTIQTVFSVGSVQSGYKRSEFRS
jgi:hypothetical protein